MRVDIWSDLQHPWSYIGKRRLDRALAAFRHRDDVVVVHRSFLLDPGTSAGRTVRAAHPLAARLGTSTDGAHSRMVSVEHAGALEGLELHLRDAVVGDTLAAHQLLHLAATDDLQWPLLERLFRAHFTERRSILDHRRLVRLAAEVGIDGRAAAGVLRTGGYVDAVHADVRQAAALGVSAVPFFLFDGARRVFGAQPTEAFSFVLERAWAEAHPVRPVTTAPLEARRLSRGLCR